MLSCSDSSAEDAKMAIRLLFVSLLIVASNVDAVPAGNVLPNSTFSAASQLTSWSCAGTSGSIARWSMDDASSAANSGSLELEAAGYIDPIDFIPLPGDVTCTSLCMRVLPDSAYTYGGQSRSVAGTVGPLTFTCQSFVTDNCNDTGVALIPAPTMSVAASWNSTAASTSGTLPSNAHSVKCDVEADSLLDDEGEFDNLFFTNEFIFASGFDLTAP
jgi:hypothetical protein